MAGGDGPPRAASTLEHSKKHKLKALNPETKAANIVFSPSNDQQRIAQN